MIMIRTFLCCRKTERVMHRLSFLYLKRKIFFYNCGEVWYAAMQMKMASPSLVQQGEGWGHGFKAPHVWLEKKRKKIE